MKLALLFSAISASSARTYSDNLNEEKSAFLQETENFWQRELQGSVGGPGFQNGCGLPAATRRSQILDVLRGDVSKPNELNKGGSPQNLAFNWLVDDDAFGICPDDEKLIQRYVMALFYFSTDGSSWTECGQVGGCAGTNFLSGTHECDWAGISCNNDDCVTEIVFEENSIGGALPYELEQLTDLEVLSLEQGSLGSTIPDEIGNLSNLRVLDLDFNMITGEIPNSVYFLTKLEQLDLNSNQIVGKLSPAVGNLQELRLIQLYENFMTGNIPNTLGTIDSLVIAEFFNNTFTGAMPQSVCDNRAPPTGTGSITGLTSDCFPNPTPQIECSCCTGCAVF